MNTDELVFVNIHGQPVNVHARPEKAPKPKLERLPYHRGWRVKGIPPEALEQAKKDAKFGKVEFDEVNWLMNAKKTALRPKPYSTFSAADDCKKLAEKASWLRVSIEEVKHE